MSTVRKFTLLQLNQHSGYVCSIIQNVIDIVLTYFPYTDNQSAFKNTNILFLIG